MKENFYKEIKQEFEALRDEKKTIEKVRTTDYPRVKKARFLVVTTDAKPKDNRNEMNFLTKRKVTGIARPFFDIPQKYLIELTDRQIFNRIPDKTNLYVVFEGERPPNFLISISLFILPAVLIFIGGFVLFRQPKPVTRTKKMPKAKHAKELKHRRRRR